MKLDLETNLSELYSEVSRRTDTAGTCINVAETSRVCSKLFEVLSSMPVEHAMILIGHGLQVNKSC